MSDPASSLNVMVDIETFGRRPRGLVVSIGAVLFDTHKEIPSTDGGGEFYAVLSWEAAVAESRFEKNLETLDWWHEGEQAAAYMRLRELMKQSTLGMRQLLEEFCKWIGPFCERGAKIWGNSPSFDLVQLENAAKEVGIRFPITHRAENDYRTLTDLVYGSISKPRPSKDIAHDPLADARFQARVCIQALRQVELWKARDAPIQT
jgi:hypothetical protein